MQAIQEQIKKSITTEIRRISAQMLTKVVDSFNVCLAAVFRQRGAWIEHVMTN